MADEIAAGGPDGVSTGSEGFAGSQVDATGGGDDGDAAATPEPLDPSYVSRAQIFNMTEEDLRTVPRATVERMLNGADRALIEAFRREQNTNGYDPRGREDASPAPQSGDFTYEPFTPTFGPEEEVAEPIVKNLTAVQAHHAKQIERLHQHYTKKFEAVHDFASSVQRQQDFAILDRFIDGLGPEWSGVFGKGPRLEMDQRSQEFLKSEELRTAAIEAMQIHGRLTGRPLPASQALSRALNAMFSEKASAIERAKADAKRKELQATATIRPKASGGNPQNSGIRARAATFAGSLRK